MLFDTNFFEAIFSDYSHYRVAEITKRKFTQAEIMPFLDVVISSGKIKKKTLGCSVQGRKIDSYAFGTGETHVLLWSQMHGDESTATAALLDLFQFLATSDKYNFFREEIARKLTLLFVPMLNPDGAELFQRENAKGIDLNRDSQLCECPESEILWSVFREFQPKYCFNLHDMDESHFVGSTKEQASLAFLAPSTSEVCEQPAHRKQAMRLIAYLAESVSHLLPQKISRYEDVFDARCFGENFQIAGAATILIESGAYTNDPERQYIRKLNFLMFLRAFSYLLSPPSSIILEQKYWQIPEDK